MARSRSFPKVVLAAAALVAGCDSPSQQFARIEAKRITVGGSTFSVRHTDYQAEAIRTNFEPGVQRRAILIKATEAIERSSSCRVLPQTVRGDTNLVRADIACAGAAEALRPPRETRLDCIGYEVGGFAGDGLIDIDCALVER